MSLLSSVATKDVCVWVGAVIHRTSRTVFIVSNIKMTLKKRGMLKLINACGRQTAIRFNTRPMIPVMYSGTKCDCRQPFESGILVCYIYENL